MRAHRWLVASSILTVAVTLVAAAPLLDNPPLQPDDYRYLHDVRALQQDFWGHLGEASVVENRWDDLWWIEVREAVRFFRPTVVLSYLADVSVWGGRYALGLTVTNVLVYLACLLLVAHLLHRWLGPGFAALAGTLLFAAFNAHGEVLYYAAGRTDSMAGLFFLAALAAHGSARRRWAAVPLYALAGLTKELTLSLPALLFLQDLWIDKRPGGARGLVRREWRLWAAYALAATGVLVVRALAIRGEAVGHPYPYFVTPLDSRFPAHLGDQLRSYSANLLLGARTISFSPAPTWPGAAAIALLLALLVVLVWRLRGDRRLWWLGLMALLVYAPTSVVYLSERYLFLPSFALAGAAALLVHQVGSSRPALRWVAVALPLIWASHQAYSLRRSCQRFSTTPTPPLVIGTQLHRLLPAIPKGARVLVANLPGPVLLAQFLQDQLRVQLDDPSLEVTVLTTMPSTASLGSDVGLRREGERTLVVEAAPGGAAMTRDDYAFPWVSLAEGAAYRTPSGVGVSVAQGSAEAARALRFDLPRPLADYLVLLWRPSPDRTMHPYYRRLWSEVRRVDL